MGTLEDGVLCINEDIGEALGVIRNVLTVGASLVDDVQGTRRTLARFLMQLRRIRTATDTVQAPDLQHSCTRLEEHLTGVVEEARLLTPDEQALVWNWPDLVMAYLTAPAEARNEANPSPALRERGWGEGSNGEIASVVCPLPLPLPLSREAGEGSINAEQQINEDLLAMLATEIATNHELLSASLAVAMSINAEPDTRQNALEDYCAQWDRMAQASESIGLTALAAACTLLTCQLKLLPLPLTIERAALLDAWSLHLQDYLAVPQDAAICENLVGVLQNSLWPDALAATNASALTRALGAVAIVAAMPETEIRPTVACPEDVSLALADDINAELLDSLLLELPIQTAALSTAIEHIASGNASFKDVERAQRAAHTLKGAANTVGVRGIATLTHHLEDILVALAKHEALPGRALCNTLTNAVDCLEGMSETLLGTGSEPENSVQTLQEILDCANRIDREGIDSNSPQVPSEGKNEEAKTPDLSSDTEIHATQAAVPMLRVPAPIVDEQLRLVGESIIANSQMQNRLQRGIAQTKQISQQHQLLEQLVAELENLVDIRGVTLPHNGGHQRKGDFDPLEFEHYSELHSVTRRLLEAATDAKEMSAQTNQHLSQLGDLLDAQRRLNLDSQQAVMRTRMVPVSSITSRLQRGVRQTCRLIDKPVTLEIEGIQTLIDGQVLNGLMDPLMHVLRNAIDHGIEATEFRAAHGKRPEGLIKLTFSYEGNHIVVRCRDDGAGMNIAAVRETAIKRRLIAADAELSDDEIARLILTPGFSTRSEATQVSGRGIGMDVVASYVAELKGSITLHSVPGKGMTVELRLPGALLSTHALLVRVRDQILAISTRGIDDIHYVTQAQVKTFGLQATYQSGDTIYELTMLDAMLSIPPDRRQQNRHGFPVLIVKTDTGAARAIQVQELLESRELVVKNLGRYVPRAPGVTGAAILGDGSVAPIIDLPELIQAPHSHADAEVSVARPEDTWTSTRARTQRVALVVDDSLSARRATAQVMKDAGFAVRMAGDGLEAVSVLEKLAPDIILVDMEMPRMNGLELTSHVRAREQTKHAPVIMITSRSTDKHRQQATSAGVNAYLTKPFNDDSLLRVVNNLLEAKP